MMMAPNLALPQIRVSDMEILGDWDFEHVKAFGDCIPGYRSSATFLTTLRSNLQLSTCPFDSPCPSLVSTPTTSAFSSNALLTLPVPSPLSIDASPCGLENLYQTSEAEPSAVHVIAAPDNKKDRGEALRLIANSVAEQRQTAVKSLILHPYSVSTSIFLTGFLARYCSLQLLFALSTTLMVAASATFYWVTKDYPRLAAEIDWEWLEGQSQKTTQYHDGGEKTYNGNSSGGRNGSWGRKHSKSNSKSDDPTVLTSRQGNEIIGALILRVIKRERKAYVRSWTVESSYRGKGIGTNLLREGVRVAWGKGARCIEFDAEHANSYRALPEEFNAGVEEQEDRAKRLLSNLLAEHRREKSSR